MEWLQNSCGALTVEVVIFRLLFAMVIGVLVGLDRELTQRPAGLRTHMLVALGSCAVMITGEMVVRQYLPLGATPDPARMAAQVVAGVGFLGAGTIIHEGSFVRGLTTAAGLWAVSCLGLAVGGGYYAVGLFGTLFILVTLVVFDWIQHMFMKDRHAELTYALECEELLEGMEILHRLAEEQQVSLRNVEIKKTGARSGSITVKAICRGRRAVQRIDAFQTGLLKLEIVREAAVL